MRLPLQVAQAWTGHSLVVQGQPCCLPPQLHRHHHHHHRDRKDQNTRTGKGEQEEREEVGVAENKKGEEQSEHKITHNPSQEAAEDFPPLHQEEEGRSVPRNPGEAGAGGGVGMEGAGGPVGDRPHLSSCHMPQFSLLFLAAGCLALTSQTWPQPPAASLVPQPSMGRPSHHLIYLATAPCSPRSSQLVLKSLYS